MPPFGPHEPVFSDASVALIMALSWAIICPVCAPKILASAAGISRMSLRVSTCLLGGSCMGSLPFVSFDVVVVACGCGGLCDEGASSSSGSCTPS